ncbi:MAG: HIT family hydrolase [Candidatus Marinimicrobia bacterium]|nr:HIT family hydrolase [Candidatus Neomarinimicrobiota bacterium]
MDRLWAPWRLEYIKGPKEEGCVFYNRTQSSNDKESLILYRGRFCFVIINLYPYNNGHLMIVPYKHESDLLKVDLKTKMEILTLVDKTIKILTTQFNPNGFNFGANIGKAGGAGIADHIHYHLVPRWNGDTNFMPIISETKILVQSLNEIYDQLKPEFDKIND